MIKRSCGGCDDKFDEYDDCLEYCGSGVCLGCSDACDCGCGSDGEAAAT